MLHAVCAVYALIRSAAISGPHPPLFKMITSISGQWRQSAAGAQNTASAGKAATQLKLIWIGSGLMVVAAAVLFLLR